MFGISLVRISEKTVSAKCGEVLEKSNNTRGLAITQWVGYVVRRGSNAEKPVLCLVTAGVSAAFFSSCTLVKGLPLR